MFFPQRIKNIGENDNVLEIGPGSNPFPRSDVYLEKNFEDLEAFKHRGLQPGIEYTKPLHYYDATRFPFKDNEFDYIICSHVLEHVPEKEIHDIFKELQRVAKRGYIEVPRYFYEYLFNFYVHQWLIDFKNGELVFLNKNNINLSPVQDVFYLMLKYGFKKRSEKLILNFRDFFMIGFEWENNISYRIVNSLNDLISERDIDFYREYFINLGESDDI